MSEDTDNRKNVYCLEIGASFLYDDYIEEAEAFRQRWGGNDPAPDYIVGSNCSIARTTSATD